MTILVELGNKISTISNSKFEMSIPTTILFSNQGKINIGCKQSQPNVIFDFMMFLGLKYHQENFSKNMKFYAFDFSRGIHDKIQIVIPKQSKFQPITKVYVQTIVALFIHHFLHKFSIAYCQGEDLIKSQKIDFAINGSSTHHQRNSLKQTIQFLSITPSLIYSPYSKMLSYYAKYLSSVKKSKKIAMLDFGDQKSSLCIFKMYGSQGVLEVLHLEKLCCGGNELTKKLSEYILASIKQQKGMDIEKYGNYMNILHCQCQNAKKLLTQDQQAFIRIPDLPDNSIYGKVITHEFLSSLYAADLSKLKYQIKSNLSQFPDVQQLLVIGNSIRVANFDLALEKELTQKIEHIGKKYNKINEESQITLLDISTSNYDISGEEGFEMRIVKKREPIPTRIIEKVKFPAGQLEFNLKVYEDGEKIGIFKLESRPVQNLFKLTFEINSNKIVSLVGSTSQGKIPTNNNLETLTKDQWQKQKMFFSTYAIQK